MARSPRGTGLQLSWSGWIGVLVGWKEGIEIRILALTIGIDPLGLAISLPGIGRLERAIVP